MPTDDAAYTLRGLEQLLGLSRAVITGLVKAGFVSPARGPRNEYRFGFQDMVLLRTAHGLQRADMSPQKIVRSLRRLRSQLPESLPLTGLRITAVGNDIVVRDGTQDVAAETGQLLLDFGIGPPARAVTSVVALQSVDDATDWFARGAALESTDPKRAEAAYRKVLELDPAHADATLNLGALVYERARFAEAVALYDAALARAPENAALHFNRAIALEDLRRFGEALAAYERCVALDPHFGDAHWNLARLYEEQGFAQKAIRHFNAYRRLQAR